MIRWGRVLSVAIWVLQVFVALLFVYAGAQKFDPRTTVWIELFAKIGIGQWFRYFTGALEVVCGILLVIPRTSTVAAALLGCTMIGAIVARLFILHNPIQAIPILFILLLILAVVAWLRREDAPRRP